MTQSELQDAREMIRAVLRNNEAALPEIRRLLPRRQATCVEMYYCLDMTQLQIADWLCISERTVRTELRCALEVIVDKTSFLNSLPDLPNLPDLPPGDLVD